MAFWPYFCLSNHTWARFSSYLIKCPTMLTPRNLSSLLYRINQHHTSPSPLVLCSYLFTSTTLTTSVVSVTEIMSWLPKQKSPFLTYHLNVHLILSVDHKMSVSGWPPITPHLAWLHMSKRNCPSPTALGCLDGTLGTIFESRKQKGKIFLAFSLSSSSIAFPKQKTVAKIFKQMLPRLILTHSKIDPTLRISQLSLPWQQSLSTPSTHSCLRFCSPTPGGWHPSSSTFIQTLDVP